MNVNHHLFGLKFLWEVQILMDLAYAAAIREHRPVSELHR